MTENTSEQQDQNSTDEQESVEVQAKITKISPLLPLIMHLETKENGEPESVLAIVFMDQDTGDVYDLDGPAEHFKEGIHAWISMKQRQMQSHMSRATPEQLRAMGIDIKNGPENRSDGIIMP